MRVRPAGFDELRLRAELNQGWDISVEALEFAPEGFGSYHWLATAAAGQRLFVTVDDLDTKPWLGEDRESVFAALGACFTAAVQLRDTAHLDFVIAPVPDSGGRAVRRLSPRYALAVFPFLDGTSGQWGEALTAGTRREILELLAALHAVSPSIAPALSQRSHDLPGRPALETALADVDRPWGSGPHSEDAQRLLGWHAADVVSWLAVYDRLAGELALGGGDLVITHGEPHPGNLFRHNGRFHLIDWDTVAIAPPERDLWMLALPGDEPPPGASHAALDFYRLNWVLQDIAAFLAVLRASHEANDDTAKALRSLEISLEAGVTNSPWT